jgi:hypothetical protein
MFTVFGHWEGMEGWKENCMIEEQKCVTKYKITGGEYWS